MNREESGPPTREMLGTERTTDNALSSDASSSPAGQPLAGSAGSQQGHNPEATIHPRCGNCYAVMRDQSNLSNCISGRKVCHKCAPALKRCNSCHDYLDQGTIAKPSPLCNCYFCGQCFNNFWRISLTDRQAYPPKCCYREVGLNLNNFEGIMEPGLLARYHERHSEWTARLPICCASCGLFVCDAFSRTTWTDPVTCRRCQVDTCPKCGQLMTSHIEALCPKDPPNPDGDTGDYPTHTCPTCKGLVTKLVEKINGVKIDAACNHLTCMVCNTDLCAHCGLRLEECSSQGPCSDGEGSDEEESQEDARNRGYTATTPRYTEEQVAEAMHTRTLSDAD